MCIIAAKPAGVKMPDKKTIERMWYGNPDGAGIMYADKGKVRISKGFMKLSEFRAELAKLARTKDLTNMAVVMHFRITTHGGTRPENTHPFPITDDLARLRQLRCSAPLAVAHNGVIDIHVADKTISDTMQYIATQLAPLRRAVPEFYKSADLMTMIQNAIRSRMAFLTKDGEIYLTGDFIEDNGVYYSNTSYKEPRYSKHWTGAWDWGNDYPNYKTYKAGSSKGKSSKGKNSKAEPVVPDVREMPLMWLAWSDTEAYVKAPDGEIFEGLDFLIDEDKTVYMYESDSDACSKFPGATAYTRNGTFMQYDEDLASFETIMPF